MNETRLRQLISSWLDGAISAEDKSILERALQEDAATRRLYLEYMSVHAELCSLESAQDYFDTINQRETQPQARNLLVADVSPSSQGLLARLAPISGRLWSLAIAVGIVVAAGIWLGAGYWQTEVSSVAELRMLDAVQPVSEDCTWYVEQAHRERANSYLAGDVIRVTEGKLQLKYAHGTEVVLHSPAAYQLINKMKARILLGRLTATVTEAAKGFSVLTPRATVVDLGTQFGVEVNDYGATDVVVFKGEVDVDFNDQTDSSSARRLRMGEAVHLDAVGTASRIVSINGRTYSNRALESLSRPAVISQVHDNIERDALMMSYYEIVHQGMREDALAFVDRVAHQWNGITKSGMPPYLLGGDYVKTFNSDKFNQSIQVSVRVDTPCRLYVLFDNRLPIPGWLKRDFRDTGDEIGLDNGPYQTTGTAWHNKGPSGIGPGESVEDALSVWVKVVAEPGIVFLGSTEAPASEPNMYGIVAVPQSAELLDDL